MSNLSDDTLRRILQQIEGQAVSATRSLSVVRAQIQSRERERKILTLTQRELADVPGECKMYKGVGKMFVLQSRKDVDGTLSAQEKTVSEDLTNLAKKSKYLQKQADEANAQLNDIFRSQLRAQEQQS
ncbi:Prefoldin [Kockovaella imperatae]|uniref:Prefoldin n=1 Tax=Kockovaella imperatae TaxID=4999 RepID=A0A1Y1UHQ0_9TREE|nr:Prefoldin [Kockovaella imperatae]ORX37552.1 Prefoldin [Kockovaella imperatae]